MFKKSLATALLVCSIPAMASASWFLSTQVTNVGGQLTTSNGTQDYTAGVVTKSYTALTAQSAPTTTPDANSTLRSVVVTDKSVVNGLPNTATISTFPFTPVDGHTYTVAATFKANLLTATAHNTGGTVSPSSVGNLYAGYKVPAGSKIVFTFAPLTGYSITGISNVPADPSIVVNVPGGVNQSATVTFPAGYTFTGSFDLVAQWANATPAINAILPQTVTAGSSVTVTASTVNVGSPSYLWSYVSGPGNTTSYANVGGKVVTTVTPGPTLSMDTSTPGTMKFTAPSAPGQYKFTVAVGTLTRLATINVLATSTDSANQCQFCHSANGIDDTTIGTRYQGSIHAQSTHAACSACHYGTANGGHPGNVNAKTVDKTTFVASMDGVIGANNTTVNSGTIFCTSCHAANVTVNYGIPHSITGLGSTCAGCHTGTSGTNGTADAHSIQAPSALTTLSNTLCENCHSQATHGNATASIYTNYKASIHGQSDGDTGHSSCAACHSGSHDSTIHASSLNVDTVTLLTKTATVQTSKGPLAQGVIFCTGCHNPIPHSTTLNAGFTCMGCHTSNTGVGGTGDPHSIQGLSCVGCHTVAQGQPIAGLVNDNSGVRAIIPEFQKLSHHIYNGPTALPTDEQCAICHLEGSVGNYGFGVDGTKHMHDQYVHLRNADTDAEFLWDPANPDHAGMDNFCMSCHDADGAKSPKIQGIQALINAAPVVAGATASAKNPFGDLLSNKYDQVTRAQVVDVFSAMDPANASHHAVRAPKYSTRVTTSAMQSAGQKTLYDGGLFADYTPLGATLSVGDDSQLHCGDCHTVGQWKNDNTKYNKAAIGAHGSNNEYMLRNNLGTDALHNGTTYVCFNCHNDKAGIPAQTAGGYYAGYTPAGASPTVAHFGSAHLGTNADFQNTAGNVGNAIAANGRLGGNMFQANNTGALVSKGGSQGNITGLSCTNCHNSGIRNASTAGGSAANTGFGGIHGGNVTYSSQQPDSLTAGVTYAPASAAQQPYRFMSGMGNFKYIPASNDTGTAAANKSSQLGTCYTNAATTDNAGYSSCNHHGAGTTTYRAGTIGNVARPLSY